MKLNHIKIKSTYCDISMVENSIHKTVKENGKGN